MQPLILFACKTVISSTILMAYYWFFLRNKLFHNFNRLFLLFVLIAAIIIPFCQINYTTSSVVSSFIQQQDHAITNGIFIEDVINGNTENSKSISWTSLLMTIYGLIVLLLFVPFVLSLLKLAKIYSTNKRVVILGKTVVLQSSSNAAPFSFFNIIFWNQAIDVATPTGMQVFKHELAHMQGKHSIDKLFANLMCMLFWYNPIFWLIKKELSMLHEFSADKFAVSNGDAEAFSKMLLVAAYPNQQFSVTNNFYFSPIKRRLTMLLKKRKSALGYFAAIIALPFIAIVFMAFTIKNGSSKKAFLERKIKVVIDAGHGGTDLGATGAMGKAEKDIALNLANKINELNSNNNIEIVLTRATDAFATVGDKVAQANSVQPDLFLSVHLHAGVDENKSSGLKIWIPKPEFAYFENSKAFANVVLNQFGTNFKLAIDKKLYQKKGTIAVLAKTQCPSILVEAGNIKNENDINYLESETGKANFANNVLKAIENYAVEIK
jgi:N-acetylmuramoyl-L-alanine amidase